MCGRYAITLPPQAIRSFFGYAQEPDFPPRYNIAPTQPVPIVCFERGATGAWERHFRLVRWGFLPGFVKDPENFPLIVNARSETVLEKPSFRAAMKRRRCLFIADAFYEWRRESVGGRMRKSRPFLVRRVDGAPMGLAGVWEAWSSAEGEIDTACILTTPANDAVAAIHDRMPAVLEPAAFQTWLDCENADPVTAWRLLAPAKEGVLEFFEIGPDVNRAANDGPWIQSPLRREQPSLFDSPFPRSQPRAGQGKS